MVLGMGLHDSVCGSHLDAAVFPCRTMANMLGILASYHDSAAALLGDGEIIAATMEGSFFLKKNDARFPVHVIEYCLAEGKIRLQDIAQVVCYDKPL